VSDVPSPLTPPDLARLRPRDDVGALIVAWVSAITAGGVALSLSSHSAVWLVGQALLALALVQWFVLLHECGHRTLFRRRWPNTVVGFVAGVLAQLPATSWRFVHARHHLWTGWQDLDPTTQGLVPRPLSRLERLVVDVAWLTGFPMAALSYRLGTFNRPLRLWRLFARPAQRRALVLGLAAHALATLALVAGLAQALGPLGALRLVLLALALAYAVQDLLMLSQHTHVPQRVAGGARVRPVPALEQPAFTRSLVFPRWASSLLLFGFDAHERHHAHPQVPGWLLARLTTPTPNALPWWRWLVEAKRLRGHVLLYKNRAETGAPL
jgi:fatty acid desaturase